MAKYSCELKKKIVEGYSCGKISYQALAIKYQIEKSVLRLRTSNYKNHGDEGLTCSRNNRAYNVELKLEAITRYETSEYSYRQFALELGLTNLSMIVNWRRQYREEGTEGLPLHKRGKPVIKKNNHSQPPKTVEKSESIDIFTREELGNRIKELEVENWKLTIQKMLWEQLRSLEKKEPTNEGRRLFPNSENNSD